MVIVRTWMIITRTVIQPSTERNTEVSYIDLLVLSKDLSAITATTYAYLQRNVNSDIRWMS